MHNTAQHSQHNTTSTTPHNTPTTQYNTHNAIQHPQHPHRIAMQCSATPTPSYNVPSKPPHSRGWTRSRHQACLSLACVCSMWGVTLPPCPMLRPRMMAMPPHMPAPWPCSHTYWRSSLHPYPCPRSHPCGVGRQLFSDAVMSPVQSGCPSHPLQSQPPATQTTPTCPAPPSPTPTLPHTW